MSNSVYTAPLRAPQEPANEHRTGPDRHPPIVLDPLPHFGDLRRLTLAQLYQRQEVVTWWCCRCVEGSIEACDGCLHTKPAERLYDQLAAEIERRPEHQQAVAAVSRRMRARR